MGTICIDNDSLFSRLSCGFWFIHKFVEEGFEILQTGGCAALCHYFLTLPRSRARDIQLYPVNACLSCEIKVRPSAPPQAILCGCSGARRVPRCFPSGEIIHSPAGPET